MTTSRCTALVILLIMLFTGPAALAQDDVKVHIPSDLPIEKWCERSSAPQIDGSLIVVDKFQSSISVIDLPTGDLVTQIPVGHGPHELALSPELTHVLVTNYGFKQLSNSLTLVDLENLEPTKTIEFDKNRRAHDVWWVSDESAWITSEGTNSIAEIEPFSGKLLREYDVKDTTAHMMAFDPAHKRAYTANILAGSISVVDLTAEPPGVPETVKINGAGEGICLSPDASELWVTDGQSHIIRVLSAEDCSELSVIECEGRPHRVRITQDGSVAVVSCFGSNEIVFVDTKQREIIARITNHSDAVVAIDGQFLGVPPNTSLPSAIRMHPNGKYAFVANINSNTITVIDLHSMTAVGVLRSGFGADGMAVSTRRYGRYATSDAK